MPALTVGDSAVRRKIVDLPWQGTGLQIVATMETSNGPDGLGPSRLQPQEGDAEVSTPRAADNLVFTQAREASWVSFNQGAC